MGNCCFSSSVNSSKSILTFKFFLLNGNRFDSFSKSSEKILLSLREERRNKLECGKSYKDLWLEDMVWMNYQSFILY